MLIEPPPAPPAVPQPEQIPPADDHILLTLPPAHHRRPMRATLPAVAAHDAIVLAGGSGRRLGGVDKAAEQVDGRSLLEHALDASAGSGTIVVVGTRRPTSRPVRWVEERQPGGGPAAALAEGLPHVDAERVLLLAADQPFAATATPRLLAVLAADEGVDGVQLADATGHTQPLLAAYRTRALRAAVARAGELWGHPFRELVHGLQLRSVAAEGDEALDCDTPATLALARRLAGAAPREVGR